MARQVLSFPVLGSRMEHPEQGPTIRVGRGKGRNCRGEKGQRLGEVWEEKAETVKCSRKE